MTTLSFAEIASALVAREADMEKVVAYALLWSNARKNGDAGIRDQAASRLENMLANYRTHEAKRNKLFVLELGPNDEVRQSTS